MNEANTLLKRLNEEKEMRLKGCLYHYTQIRFAYNSNRIEGSQLTEDETRYIYETNSICTGDNKTANINDIVETVNHFSCFNYLLDVVERPLSHEIIKEFHGILKRGSEDSFKGWFKIGDYKTKNNFIGDRETVAPSEVLKKMDLLINNYLKEGADIHKIIDFHYEFEKIHPFQDGNGRVGRLIMFKECLKNNIVPFVIENENKQFYYMGLKEYEKSKTRLVETCLYSQDVYKDAVKYFIDGSVKQIKNNDNLIKNIHIPLENDKILSVMNCYKYEVKEENIIDFRGKELFIDSTEIIFGKKNIIKMNCKDKEGKDLYLLQRTGKEKMEIWYFDKDFTIASSKEFIKQFDCKFTKNEQNIVKNKMCR